MDKIFNAKLLVNEIIEKITDYTYNIGNNENPVTNERGINESDLMPDSNLRNELISIINKHYEMV